MLGKTLQLYSNSLSLSLKLNKAKGIAFSFNWLMDTKGIEVGKSIDNS